MSASFDLSKSLLLILFSLYHRRTYKACCKCGTFGRSDNLKNKHMPACQPKLKKMETGFLKNGHLPEKNIRDFKMVLKMLSGSMKEKKTERKSSVRKRSSSLTKKLEESSTP